MKFLVLMLLLLTDDITDARRRYEDALAKQEGSSAPVQPESPPEVVIDPPEETRGRVEVSWTTSQSEKSSAASVSMILVGESYCKPCHQKEQEFQRQGISYQKMTVNEAVLAGLPLKRNANNNVPIPQWFPTSAPAQSSSPPDRVIAEVTDSLESSIIPLLSQHLDSQSGGERPVSGILDIDVEAPAYLPDLLNGILINQTWEHREQRLTLDWSGSRAIKVDSGRVTFSPPIKITKLVGPLSVRATLDSLTVSQSGRQIDLSLGGAPDMTILLKGMQYQSAVTTSAPAPVLSTRASPNLSDKPQNYTDQDRQNDINHLLTGPTHAGKFTREYLETMSGYELIDLHNADHGVPTFKGVKIR